jgi:hypothetical protein
MAPRDGADDVRQIIDEAAEVTPQDVSACGQPMTADDAEITRLAALSPLEYDRERAAAAERLGCRVSSLDSMVAAARSGSGRADPGGRGRPLLLADVESWPLPVDGAALLDEIARMIRCYIVLDEAAADAVALWVVHAHAIEAAYVSRGWQSHRPRSVAARPRS